MTKENDLRIIKTEQAIKNAFLKLIAQENIADLTVQQILDEALINRSTFYAHYHDKYDLQNHIEDELLNGFATRAEKNIKKIVSKKHFNKEVFRHYLTEMLEYVENNRNLFSIFLNSQQHPTFLAKFALKEDQIWRKSGLIKQLGISEKYTLAALSGMISGILTEWAKSQFADKKEDVVETLLSLLMNISSTVIVTEINS